MTTPNSQTMFQEFDRFKLPQGDLTTHEEFQAWNPFVGEQPSLRDVKLEEFKAREEEIQRKQAVLTKKEEECVQKEAVLDELISRAKIVADELEAIKKNHWEVNARELAEFAITLAEKIVMEKVTEDPTLLYGQIKTALDSLKANQAIEIHLCPEDLDFLQKSQKENIAALFSNKQLSWMGDMRLSRGKIYIDVEQYRLDASVMAAIKNIRAAMLSGVISDAEASAKTVFENSQNEMNSENDLENKE